MVISLEGLSIAKVIFSDPLHMHDRIVSNLIY